MEQFGDLHRGAVIELDGELYIVVDKEFRNPGNWRAMVQLKLKSLRTGAIIERRCRPEDKVEVAFVDQREADYLYNDGRNYYFMDMTTYEQEPIPADSLGEGALYLLPGTRVQLKYYDNKPISVELPKSVRLTVKQTEPAIKGATVQAQYKPAITETGLKVMVPPFINVGDVVEIDTRTGEYLSRASK